MVVESKVVTPRALFEKESSFKTYNIVNSNQFLSSKIAFALVSSTYNKNGIFGLAYINERTRVFYGGIHRRHSHIQLFQNLNSARITQFTFSN